MTANSDEYVAYIMERLQPLGRVSSGRFFGGTGLSIDGVQFGMLMGNTLYLATNDDLRGALEKLGGRPFSYSTKNGTVTVKKYCEVPGEVVEDEEQLRFFALRSINAARNRTAPAQRVAAARSTSRRRSR